MSMPAVAEKEADLKMAENRQQVGEIFSFFKEGKTAIFKSRYEEEGKLLLSEFREVLVNSRKHGVFLSHYQRYLESNITMAGEEKTKQFQSIILALQHLRRMGLVSAGLKHLNCGLVDNRRIRFVEQF